MVALPRKDPDQGQEELHCLVVSGAHLKGLFDIFSRVMGEAILLELGGPADCLVAIWSHVEQSNERLQVLDFLGQSAYVGSQLGGRLAILGDVVHASEILGLAGVALGANAIALHELVLGAGWMQRDTRQRTFDLRLRQLSHAMDVILPRGVRKAYVPEMGDECCPRAFAREPPGPCLGASGAL